MEEELNCPVCGTAIRPDSAFCRKCGKEIRRCPQCMAPLPKGVMFCPRCNAHLEHYDLDEGQRHSPGGEDEPYVVWEGWPFATLSKVVQTRRQWWITVIILAIGIGMMIAYWIALTLTADSDEQCCMGVFACVIAVIAALGLLLRYKIGRENAERELKEKNS